MLHVCVYRWQDGCEQTSEVRADRMSAERVEMCVSYVFDYL